MRVVWQLGEATVKDIQQRLPDHPHYNSVLTIVRVLDRKGHLVHRAEGKTYYYSPGESKEKARGRLLRRLVDQAFGGSAASAVMNLVETGDLTKEDLDEIRRKVSKLSKEKRNASTE